MKPAELPPRARQCHGCSRREGRECHLCGFAPGCRSVARGLCKDAVPASFCLGKGHFAQRGSKDVQVQSQVLSFGNHQEADRKLVFLELAHHGSTCLPSSGPGGPEAAPLVLTKPCHQCDLTTACRKHGAKLWSPAGGISIPGLLVPPPKGRERQMSWIGDGCWGGTLREWPLDAPWGSSSGITCQHFG